MVAFCVAKASFLKVKDRNKINQARYLMKTGQQCNETIAVYIPDQLCLSTSLILHELLLPLVQTIDTLLAVVYQQLVEPDHGLLLHLPLDAAGPLPPHDPDGVPGLHVIIIYQITRAHDARPATPLGAMNAHGLQNIQYKSSKIFQNFQIPRRLSWHNHIFLETFVFLLW